MMLIMTMMLRLQAAAKWTLLLMIRNFLWKKELLDIDRFADENEDDGSGEDQKSNDDNGSSKDEAQ